MSRFDGVDPITADCKRCGRKKGFPCAKKATREDVVPGLVAVGDWCGASKRSHPARVTAAMKAKMKGGAA
jgi:hypothetical protein